MSTGKNKEALQAMRAKYKETFGEEPAPNLGMPQLTKKIKEYEADGSADPAGDSVEESVNTPDTANAADADGESAEVAGYDDNGSTGSVDAVVGSQEDTIADTAAPVDDSEDPAPVSPSNRKPITAADMKVERVMITNGKVTKPYTKYAWDNFLSKAPGKWKLVASTPPEVLSLKGGKDNG